MASVRLSTFVVVPTLLTRQSRRSRSRSSGWKIHYLAEPGRRPLFCPAHRLDAMQTRSTLRATRRCSRLQRRASLSSTRVHGRTAGDRFLLLHRRRIWNETERQWMGWERKRGKLHEFNRLLRGATDTTFMPTDGDAAVPGRSLCRSPSMPIPGCRVDTVRRLIGKMAHPLNQPRFDPEARTCGRRPRRPAAAHHAVAAASVASARFSSAFSPSPGGIDPYASAVSDVYQDFFGEGSYTGKGIYDVDAFEAALAGRVPDNALLSHDLFEGIFARAGLVSDVEVVEDFPPATMSPRAPPSLGAWRLAAAAWILGRPLPDGRTRLAMPPIGRWKMLDNLRRTLSAPAAILAFLAGWTLPLDAAALWTGFVLATIIPPLVYPLRRGIVPVGLALPCGVSWAQSAHDLRLALAQSALMVTFLAHQAWLMGDAIVRTFVRMFVTRRHLLEWISAAQATLGPN